MRQRLSLLRACALAVGVSVLLASCQGLNRQPSASEGVQGRIAWPKDSDLWVYNLSTQQQQKITNLPNSSAVTGASWSPDGKRIVYSQFWRRPNERASGADLFVANADGSNAHIFAERETANGVLEAPQWAPSGRVYYSVRRTQAGREALSIVRQTEGGQSETLVDGGYSPTVSQDESTLVYLKATRAGQAMLKKTIGQQNDCELLSDQVFQYLSQPRISPDGTRVALGGSGEANGQPSGCGGDNRTKPSAGAPLLLLLASWLEPAIAYAHGAPADVYTLGMDGSGLTRVADIKDDDPTVAWSPDGARLAIFGIAALYVVDSKGGPPTKLVEQGGYGGLDWTR
jgi:Tol biopolymer transport system component